MTKKALMAVLVAGAVLLAPMDGQLEAQQTGVVTGQVTDAQTGEPIVGAQVSVEGTRQGSVTGENGRYTITAVPAGTFRVQAQHIAHAAAHQENVRVVAGETVTVDLALRDQVLAVEEIVATGLVDPVSGIRSPFSIARVSAEDMPVPTTTSAAGAIAGKVAGAQILRSSGVPGSGVHIQLRTPTSTYGSNSPMFVVDGVVLSQSFSGTTADIEALDIESIEVIRGAAAASMYGSRAANGVVSITTRRGGDIEHGRTRIQVRSEYGQHTMGNTIPMAMNHHYRVNEEGYYTNTLGDVVAPTSRQTNERRMVDTPFGPYPTFDHIAQFFNPGAFQGNSVSIGQNLDNTNWIVSFNQYHDFGVFPDNDGYQRYNLRLNLDHRFRDDFNIRMMMYHNRSVRDELHSVGAAGQNPFDMLIRFRPDANLAAPNIDGTPWRIRPDPTVSTRNPVYEQITREWITLRQRTQGSLTAQYRPMRWLAFDGSLGYDRSDRGYDRYLAAGTITSLSEFDQADEEGETDGAITTGNEHSGYLRYNSAFTDSFTGTFTATVLNNFGPLTARSYYRAVMERDFNRSFTVNSSDMMVQGVKRINVAEEVTASSSMNERISEGHMIATALDFDDKYIADVMFRRDGSSLFGADARWNNYYRAALNWRMSQERWFNVPGINEFQLRYSQGTAGSRPNFAWQYETFTVDATGITKGTLGNRFLAPEHTTERDFTIRTIFADNKFNLDLTRVFSSTRDQLLPVTLPGPYGFNTQRRNAGTIEGRTWEATLEAHWISSPQLSWRSNLVLDRSRHQVTEFNRPCYQEGLRFYCEGLILGEFYTARHHTALNELLYRHDHETIESEFQVNDYGVVVWVGEGNTWQDGLAKDLWGTQGEVDGWNYRWGHPIEETDELGTQIRGVTGDSNVDANFGFGNHLRVGGFSLYGLVRGQIGGDIYNSAKNVQYQRWRHGDVDHTHSPDELKKTVDFYSASDGLALGGSFTEYFAESAQFAKLAEVRLAYRVPADLLERFGPLDMQRMDLALVGRNLYTLTGYSGYDPEVGSNFNRRDNRGYPLYRTFTGEVRVQF